MIKNKKLGFTLAEVLIVIGIIGVVAALTLPNLNHATGDKETVTRLQKAYSILNEANDRAVAIYGPVSTWSNSCSDDIHNCWMRRIGEFLKISKSCDETVDSDSDNYSSCDLLKKGEDIYDNNAAKIIYQLKDDISFTSSNTSGSGTCDIDFIDNDSGYVTKNICFDEIFVDINGPTKGKNISGQDIFRFMVADKIGVLPYYYSSDGYGDCLYDKNGSSCSFWVLEYGNLDYLKANEEGKCNDSNIILDGVNNTSCH